MLFSRRSIVWPSSPRRDIWLRKRERRKIYAVLGLSKRKMRKEEKERARERERHISWPFSTDYSDQEAQTIGARARAREIRGASSGLDSRIESASYARVTLAGNFRRRISRVRHTRGEIALNRAVSSETRATIDRKSALRENQSRGYREYRATAATASSRHGPRVTNVVEMIILWSGARSLPESCWPKTPVPLRLLRTRTYRV